MKKQFKLEINNPCDADLNAMEKTNTGFFCSSCVKNVIDLSSKTNAEVAQFIAKNKNHTSICARLRSTQLEQEFEYNEISKVTNFKYAVAVAASVLLTTTVVGQEKTTQNTEQTQISNSGFVLGKVKQVVPLPKILSLKIEGRLLDSTTNKPISKKLFRNMKIQIYGLSNYYKVNSKTGQFSIPIKLNTNTKTITFTVISNDHSLTKTISVDLTNQTSPVFTQDLIVNPKTGFEEMLFTGSVGVNYINHKKTISNS